MEKFEPSQNFVARVMNDVRVYELSLQAVPTFSIRLLGSRPARWAISAAAMLLGSWNLIRLYLSFLAPVVCR